MADKPKRLDAENFVRIWQTSGSPEDFVQRSGGCNFEGAYRRAAYLRRRGVPLKKFPRKHRAGMDIERLKALTAEFAPVQPKAPEEQRGGG